jgi:phosphoglycolate phosphatase
VIIDLGKKALKTKQLNDKTISSVMDQIDSTIDKIELENVNNTKPIVGALEILRSFKQEGRKIGVLTRGCREYAEKALSVTKMIEMVDILLARDDVAKPKPDPLHLFQIIEVLELTPQQVLLIGDSTLDASCAQSVGVKFIGVLTGVASEEELKQYNHLSIITNLTDLIITQI